MRNNVACMRNNGYDVEITFENQDRAYLNLVKYVGGKVKELDTVHGNTMKIGMDIAKRLDKLMENMTGIRGVSKARLTRIANSIARYIYIEAWSNNDIDSLFNMYWNKQAIKSEVGSLFDSWCTKECINNAIVRELVYRAFAQKFIKAYKKGYDNNLMATMSF